MSTKTRPRKDLLERGAGSYLDALTAIEAFDSKVEAKCRAVYLQHEPKLLAQMGLDRRDCERHRLPSPGDREAEIGICRAAQKGGPRFYLYLWWRDTESGAPEVSGAVALDLRTKRLKDEIYNRFRRRNPGCRVAADLGDYHYLLLTTSIKPGELSSVADILDQLVREWLGYCKSIGGLRLKKL